MSILYGTSVVVLPTYIFRCAVINDIVIETSILNHLASKIFINIMAIISLMIVLVVVMLIFKGEKM